MRLSYLKLFCDLARCRSFSEAASLNHVSQSAASQVVLQLEKRLGVKLVDRSTRPLLLTPEGEAYHEACRNLLDQYHAVEASIRKTKAQASATVQVAAIYSVGLRDMNQYINRFSALLPGSTVHIEYLHPERVYERVMQGRSDLGLVSYPRKSRELVAFPWRQEEMVLACAPNHPLAKLKSVKISQLEGVKYIGFDRDLVIRRHVDRFLRQYGVSVDIVLEFDNIENIKKAIEESGGVSLLPEPMLTKEVNAGTLAGVRLANAALIRPLGIIYRRTHPLTRAAQQFITLLREPDVAPGASVLSKRKTASRPSATQD
ncbi:MAG: LysR family transcriptional regulator [Acidobacteria bacterium]|nr:MAG: LysR family transcriptional regulator [Acidobacteriota bacterium]